MTLDKYLVAKYVIIFRSVSCFVVFFWLVGTSTLELYQLRGVLDCVVSRKGGFRLLARCFATTSSK